MWRELEPCWSLGCHPLESSFSSWSHSWMNASQNLLPTAWIIIPPLKAHQNLLRSIPTKSSSINEWKQALVLSISSITLIASTATATATATLVGYVYYCYWVLRIGFISNNLEFIFEPTLIFWWLSENVMKVFQVSFLQQVISSCHLSFFQFFDDRRLDLNKQESICWVSAVPSQIFVR